MAPLPGLYLPLGVQSKRVFPFIRSTSRLNSTSATNSILIPYPSGIQAGDILFVTGSGRGNSSRTVYTPPGWTQLWNRAGGGDHRAAWGFWKFATGSESGTLSINYSAGLYSAAIMYCIGDAEALEVSSAGTSQNPPAISPSWGAKPTLFITAANLFSTDTTPDPPTGYTNVIRDNGGNNAKCATAHRFRDDATTEDPGSWSLSQVSSVITATVAILGKYK